MYDHTLTYGTCESFRSLYSFHINVYDRSYFMVLPIKDLINKDGKSTNPFKVKTVIKPSIPHLCILLCPNVVRKATENVRKKGLNMRHQAQKGFHSTFVGIPQYQKGYLVYVPHKQNILSSHDVVFDESLSSALEYT